MTPYTFRRLDKNGHGSIPYHTCPDIDSIIQTLQELRKSNSQLREAAEYWKDSCEEACDERDEFESNLDEANDEIVELKNRLEKV